LQPTLRLFMIISIIIIEKMRNTRDVLHQREHDGEEERCERCFVSVCATVTTA
jgi:hypothetical protein